MSKSRVSRNGLVALLAVVVIGGGALAYYITQVMPTAQVQAEPELQTARARTGEIIITATGAGNLVPATELDLGFRLSGTLAELQVSVGDGVEAGQVLARLDDSVARLQMQQAELDLAMAEANLARLTSAGALAEARLALVADQAALADARAALNGLLAPDVAYYADTVADAQRAYDTAVANAELVTTGSKSQEQAVANAAYAVELAQGKLNDAIRWYGADSDKAAAAQATLALAQSDLAAAQIALQVAVANQASAVADAGAALADAQASYAYVTDYRPPSDDVALAEAQVAAAESALAESQALVAELQGEPSLDAAEPTTLAAARAQVAQAALAVEAARLTLNNTVLVAPISGTVTAVNASAGEAVGTTPIVTLAALDELLVRFYVEENDLGKVAAGYPVSVIFDAAPDVPVVGEVTRVDPALVSIDGSPAVQAWARLDAPEGVLSLVSGLSAEIEIVAGEARDALLVPVQALRELAPGSYAVFVVGADGQLKLTPVTVGLKDFANAQILTGLQAGDVVSTGTIETK